MPYYKICYSVVQVRKFAPHLHHTMKSFAILHNFIDNYNILIIFAIYQQTAKYQCIYQRHKIAIFKYCPGHTKPKPQLIVNRLRFFIFVLFAPHLHRSSHSPGRRPGNKGRRMAIHAARVHEIESHAHRFSLKVLTRATSSPRTARG